ncbi:MAG: type II toxin-antitoxin system ParD family antitoxin [Thermomicrobiales bacterium]|nr:type II toxin-antitoxin system ParD family antitoxin [Thermomicrobiales bacterium]
MSVEIDPQLESVIREKVRSGQYIDIDDVVREALDLLQERDRYEQLRAAVQLGLDDVAAGRVRAWTPERLAEIRRAANEDDRVGVPISPDVRP